MYCLKYDIIGLTPFSFSGTENLHPRTHTRTHMHMQVPTPMSVHMHTQWWHFNLCHSYVTESGKVC